MTDSFSAATAVEALGDGRYAGRVAPGWDISGFANGGYLLALAGRAMVHEVGRPPLTVTAHFLAPGLAGPCRIDVSTIREGRRTATASARLRTGDTEVLAVLGSFAEVGNRPDVVDVVDLDPPDLPPIGECIVGGPPGATPDATSFADRVVCAYHPDDIGFGLGQPSGRALMRAWCRFVPDEPIDAVGLLLFADAMAPVTFNRPEYPVSRAPTIELTVHVRGVPSPGPLRGVFESHVMQGGLFEESGVLFDADGDVVAQSRQLALIPTASSF